MVEYKRVVLKLSGEALAGENKTGCDEAVCMNVAKQVKALVDQGIQVAIVIGGGNFWRGRSSAAIDRTKADQIGMLATVMNCIYMSEILRLVGIKTKVYTPFSCGSMTQLFSKDDALALMNAGGVAFLAGGTGHPYFSTDTTAALRAAEIEAEVILMAKRGVDGVFSADPTVDATATKYDQIGYLDLLNKGLQVIDATAASLCMVNNIPIIVFDFNKQGSALKAVMGESIGTLIGGGE